MEQAPFPLSGESWTNVFARARKQTVTGTAWQGLCLLPEACLPPESLMLRWAAEADAIERRNRRVNRVLAHLFDLWSRHEVCAVLQKGQGVAAFYEHPLTREPGDIDLYFPDPAHRKRAARLVQAEGCRLLAAPDGSVHYRLGDIVVEHHARLLDLHNPLRRSWLKALEQGKGFEEQTLDTVPNTTIRVPAPALNLLLLNAHILKHAAGRGIGLRQLCDLARAFHCLHDRVDGEELTRICRRAGLARWSRQLYAFLTEWLGLPADELPTGDARKAPCRELLRIVLEGGNFGQADRRNGQTGAPAWRRKWHTATAFCRHGRFALTAAPGETFWTMMSLAGGQLR